MTSPEFIDCRPQRRGPTTKLETCVAVRSLVGIGGALTLLSAAVLAFGYAPSLFVHSDPALETLTIDAKCTGGTKPELLSHFGDPAPLASHVAVNVTIDNIVRCKSYWISTKDTATVKLLSSEAVFAGEKREVRRDVPFKAGTTPGSRIFEFETKGMSRYWFVMIERPFIAYRTGFDRYSVAGNLSLGNGDWKFSAASAAEYTTSGETELKKTVTSDARPEDSDLGFRVTATFPHITEYKDVFIIIVSTLLGVAVSSLVQGASTMPERKRGKSGRSGADA